MPGNRSERKWTLLATLAVVGILLFWLGFSIVHSMQQADVENAESQAPYTLAGKDLHPVVIHAPDGPPVAVVGTHPETGEPLTASCTTCHTARPADATHGFGNTPDEFHQGLAFNHGNGALSCISCHNPDDYDTLRAANGETITYPNVISLCAQCHSDQHNDYQHGAHGGMNGYWDLSQGPRVRNSCIDCHDPHAPAFPMMQPTFKPIDRGLDPGSGAHGESDGRSGSHGGPGHE
ncbi:MAG: hypothetical protein AAGA29_06295 [Planctomycetota bacterium]